MQAMKTLSEPLSSPSSRFLFVTLLTVCLSVCLSALCILPISFLLAFGFYIHLFVCGVVYMCNLNTCCMQHVCGGQELVLSYDAGSRDQTQVIRLVAGTPTH